MKICKICGIEKDSNEFRLRKIKDRTYLLSICIECEKEKDRNRYNSNIEVNREKKKLWKREKRRTDGVKQRKIGYSKKDYYDKTKNLPINIIKRSVRRRLSKYLKRFDHKKTCKTYQIIGCTPEELKNHIQSLFKDGMNWDNYGFFGWHIDHIIPLSSASNLEEMLKLNHYSNLQPLWFSDNLSKSNKLI